MTENNGQPQNSEQPQVGDDHSRFMEETQAAVRELLDKGMEGQKGLVELVESIHPADLADIIEQLDEDERRAVFGILPVEVASRTLAETRDRDQSELIRGMDDQTLQEVFEELPDDDATDIVQELTEEEAERVLEAIAAEDRAEIQSLMRYPEESAGGVMTREYVAVRMGLTAQEAIEEVRRQGREIEFFAAVYVIDSRRKLKGVVTLSDLVLAEPGQKIAEIMETDVVSVQPELDQEELARLLGRYNLVSMPVVNRNGLLLGRVTVDDVMEIIEEEVTEDIFRMSGVDEAESLVRMGVWDSIRSRLPWLCLNLGLLFISAQIIGLYIHVLEKATIMAMFLPVVAGIGGHTSTQSLAVTLRRLILDEGITERKRKLLVHELSVGLLNGVAVSLLIFAVVFMTQGNTHISMVVAVAALTSMTVAGFIGAIMPLALKTFGFDPTVSSSVVHNFTDILGFFLLLGLSALMLM